MASSGNDNGDIIGRGVAMATGGDVCGVLNGDCNGVCKPDLCLATDGCAISSRKVDSSHGSAPSMDDCLDLS